jgi:hypothetical protein
VVTYSAHLDGTKTEHTAYTFFWLLAFVIVHYYSLLCWKKLKENETDKENGTYGGDEESLERFVGGN